MEMLSLRSSQRAFCFFKRERKAVFLFLSLCAFLFASLPAHAQTTQPTLPPKTAPVSVPAKAENPKPSPVLVPAKAALPEKATTPAPKTLQKKKKRVFLYDIFFRGSKAGTLQRTEITRPNGTSEMKSESSFKVSMLFFKMEGINRSSAKYDSKGMLLSFKVYAKVRGKESTSWGTRDAQGIQIFRKTPNAKEPSKKLFPAKDFDATSLDIAPIPMQKAQPGQRFSQKLLRIDQQRLVTQDITIFGAGKQSFQGKEVSLLRLKIKGPQWTGDVVLAKEGWMISTTASSRFGSFEMKLKDFKETP